MVIGSLDTDHVNPTKKVNLEQPSASQEWEERTSGDKERRKQLSVAASVPTTAGRLDFPHESSSFKVWFIGWLVK